MDYTKYGEDELRVLQRDKELLKVADQKATVSSLITNPMGMARMTNLKAAQDIFYSYYDPDSWMLNLEQYRQKAELPRREVLENMNKVFMEGTSRDVQAWLRPVLPVLTVQLNAVHDPDRDVNCVPVWESFQSKLSNRFNVTARMSSALATLAIMEFKADSDPYQFVDEVASIMSETNPHINDCQIIAKIKEKLPIPVSELIMLEDEVDTARVAWKLKSLQANRSCTCSPTKSKVMHTDRAPAWSSFEAPQIEDKPRPKAKAAQSDKVEDVAMVVIVVEAKTIISTRVTNQMMFHRMVKRRRKTDRSCSSSTLHLLSMWHGLCGTFHVKGCQGTKPSTFQRLPRPIHQLYHSGSSSGTWANRELRGFLQSVRAIAASESVARHISNEGINWVFIPPGAPHFGGLWEAGVKSVKYHLKRAIRRHTQADKPATKHVTPANKALLSEDSESGSDDGVPAKKVKSIPTKVPAKKESSFEDSLSEEDQSRKSRAACVVAAAKTSPAKAPVKKASSSSEDS
ncbi:unnamed protein product [Allacma fusca]|uniref:Uncharacterized protein n=1 Tax=Allacma fusca TaxID=39272 RepID=A0A8J2KQK1_9HEXA|nr:unnamed protein product [Allacma fusca]